MWFCSAGILYMAIVPALLAYVFWDEAVAIARNHPNAYLDLCGLLGQWSAVERPLD